MNTDLTMIISQFGAAGLMGLLWIAERRHAAARERQLNEAHRQVVEQRLEASILVRLVRDNTRALVGLEHTQQRLCRALDGLARREHALADASSAVAETEPPSTHA